MNDAPATFLPWDTEHFGCRIARANIHQLDAASWRQLEGWCREQSIDCLYFLASAADQDTIFELQARQFSFVDIRLTFEYTLPSAPAYAGVENLAFRMSNEEDVPRFIDIAKNSYKESRFYADPCFDSEKVSLMYQTWLTKSIATDFADAVVVAELNQQPAGFLTCHLNRPEGEGNLGLSGVAELARGMGLGQCMYKYGVHWLYTQGMNRVNAVTQGSNIAVQRLFQRCGFVTRSVELWYHKWFIECPQEA